MAGASRRDSVVRRLREGLTQASWFTRETWIGYGLVVPATALMLVIIIYPTVRALWISFNRRSLLDLQTVEWVGLANYQQIIQDPKFFTAMEQTIILTVGAVASMYLLGLGLALLLRHNLPGLGKLQSLSMVSWVIPPVVIVIMWDWMLQVDFGLVNLILQMFGGPNKTWFGTRKWALALVTMMRVWKDTPFVAIALLASMQSIPKDYYEAARIDGANRLQTFRHITLPNIAYISMIMIVVETITAFNSFQLIWIATGGGPVDSTEVLGTYVYKQAFNEYALGYASAVGAVMLLLLTVFTIIYIYVEDTE